MDARRPIRTLAALIAALALTGLGAAPALADAPRDTDPGAPPVVALDAAGSGVDDFEFESFDAVYELGRDASDRSTLHVTETLVALFPDFDQNRGIRRAIPNEYQGHSTGIDVLSVTDGTGTSRAFESSTDGEFALLTIAVPEGQYVHGSQTYVIEYTLRDVTARLTDSRDGVTRDEFYWDVNGTGWAQPFGRVSARVSVAPYLVDALAGDPRCYYGYDGTAEVCDATLSDGVAEATAVDLFPHQTLTIDVPFQTGTFGAAPWWTYVPILALVAIALVVAAFVVALVVRFVLWRDAPGRGIVVAQYEPPPGVSAMLAANIVGAPKKGMAASLVDLAVRKNLRILEHDQGWSKVFGVQKLSAAALGPDEQRVMGALFSINPFAFGGILPGLRSVMSMGGQAAVPQPEPDGDAPVRWLTKGDTVLGQQVVALTKAVAKETEAGGLRRVPSRRPLLLVIGAMALAGVLLLVQMFTGADTDLNVAITVIGLNVLPWLAIFSIGALARRRPLTAKGSELREHLEGLREYIRLAEADRLQMLQSVSGAERISTTDGREIVKIYERLLPYAVLFGLEKQWAQEIAKYYDTTPPDWYSGSNGFAVGAFAAGIGSLSSSVSTSYSGSSSSSSSGGGGGGGSAGGGGGGGGGGGV